MTISLWQRTPANEEITCEVAIVGAGITGLSAALELEAQGRSCVILEADWIGSKASGRNAGYLMRGGAENYALTADKIGREAAAFVWKWTEENLRGLKALGIESTPGYAARPSCLIATSEDEEAELRRAVAMMREDGFAAEIVEATDPPQDPIWWSGKPRLGLVNPHDAVCSPMELIDLLGAGLSSTPVFEQAEVYRMEQVDGRVCLRTKPITVHASRVLLCTNAYGAQLAPSLAEIITPHRGQMLAMKPKHASNARLEYSYYINRGSEYVRSAPNDQIIFGGARTYHAANEATANDDTTAEVQEHLESFVRELITDEYTITARWSGIMGFTPDGLPVIGAVPVNGIDDGKVWFCGGLTGHGMSMGYTTARHSVRVMLEDEHTRFSINRFD
ncbi:MAG: FAD-binding oxidoreductase [Phycisphaerales bacterium]|nr:FAD-binding oxidoreductase [Phycisphaerales bacterium]